MKIQMFLFLRNTMKVKHHKQVKSVCLHVCLSVFMSVCRSHKSGWCLRDVPVNSDYSPAARGGAVRRTVRLCDVCFSAAEEAAVVVGGVPADPPYRWRCEVQTCHLESSGKLLLRGCETLHVLRRKQQIPSETIRD